MHPMIKFRSLWRVRNKNTTKVTTTWMNMYHTWSKHRGEVLEIAKVERKKLEETFYFFTKLKKTRQTRL